MKQDLSSWKTISSKIENVKVLEKLEIIKKRLIEERHTRTIPFLTNIDNDDDLKIIDQIKVAFIKFSKIIVVGIGGSSLGGRALVSLTSNERVSFLENLDSNTIFSFIKNINIDKTGILVISKSGKTTETISIASILFSMFSKRVNVSEHAFIMTENKKSELYKLADSYKIRLLFYPEGIGGRFSCLSSIGLIPAALSGIDPAIIKKTARKKLNEILNDEILLNENSPFTSAFNYSSLMSLKKYNVLALICYGDNLADFGLWFRQLWAESLGKNQLGIHPLSGIGSIEQHSQLQLWLDGPDNVIFTFVIPRRSSSDLKIPELSSIPEYLRGKEVNEVLEIMAKSTLQVLVNNGKPVRIISVDRTRNENISELMIYFMIEIIIIAELMEINAYDQPAVELVKIKTKQILSGRNEKN